MCTKYVLRSRVGDVLVGGKQSAGGTWLPCLPVLFPGKRKVEGLGEASASRDEVGARCLFGRMSLLKSRQQTDALAGLMPLLQRSHFILRTKYLRELLCTSHVVPKDDVVLCISLLEVNRGANSPRQRPTLPVEQPTLPN